jgi:hypothetical protein
MRSVSFVSIIYAEEDYRFAPVARRWSDLIRTIARYPDLDAEFVVVDNSPRYTGQAYRWLVGCGINFQFLWCGGFNCCWGGALNLAVGTMAKKEIIVHVQSTQGRMYDPTWLGDLVAPLEDRRVGQTGTVLPCFDDIVADTTDPDYEQIMREASVGRALRSHVQGSLFAARAEVLRRHPVSARFPHEYSDVILSRRLRLAGYELVDVPTIKIVRGLAGEIISEPQRYKYVIDYRQEDPAAEAVSTSATE